MELHSPPVPMNAAPVPSIYSSDTESLSSDDGGSTPLQLKTRLTTAGIAAVLSRHQSVRLRKPLPGDALCATVDEHIKQLVRLGSLDDTFYVVDLGIVARLFAGWRAAMPRVEPFYAVKCNGGRLLPMLTRLASDVILECECMFLQTLPTECLQDHESALAPVAICV